MNITPIAPASVFGGAQSTTAQTERDTFLRLLVTQLNFQDPLSPIKNEDFAAQLAQFSSLEQLQQINANLSNAALSNDGMSQTIGNLLASTLIGKTVEATGNSLVVQDGKATDITYRLASDADTVTVTIVDASGRRVRQLSLDPQAAGDRHIRWDRRDQNGRIVPDGAYAYTVSASNQDTAVNAVPLIRGRVDGVTYDNGQVHLNVDNRSVPLSEVSQVMETME